MHRILLNDSANAINNDIGNKTLQQYLKAIKLIRDRLIMSSVNFEFYSMTVGAAAIWLVSTVYLINNVEFEPFCVHFL